MKTAAFGFEASLNGNAAVCSNAIMRPLTIRAIQFDVSLMRNDVGLLHSPYKFTELLARAHIFRSLPIYNHDAAMFPHYTGNPDFAAPVTHGAPSNGGGIVEETLVSVILKSEVSGADSRSVCLSSLDVPVSAGSYFILYMGHAGVAADAEMQGVLYYE